MFCQFIVLFTNWLARSSCFVILSGFNERSQAFSLYLSRRILRFLGFSRSRRVFAGFSGCKGATVNTQVTPGIHFECSRGTWEQLWQPLLAAKACLGVILNSPVPPWSRSKLEGRLEALDERPRIFVTDLVIDENICWTVTKLWRVQTPQAWTETFQHT